MLARLRREEAEAKCRRLAAEHPERHRYRWFARRVDGEGWVVVRVAARPGARVDPLRATTEAKPKPPHADDPRTSYSRNVGSDWFG